jgi:uncharacterized membrane protein
LAGEGKTKSQKPDADPAIVACRSGFCYQAELRRRVAMLVRRPFTFIAAIIFLIIAFAHVYRLATGFQVVVGSHTLPMPISWVGLAVGALLGIMLIVEARR